MALAAGDRVILAPSWELDSAFGSPTPPLQGQVNSSDGDVFVVWENGLFVRLGGGDTSQSVDRWQAPSAAAAALLGARVQVVSDNAGTRHRGVVTDIFGREPAPFNGSGITEHAVVQVASGIYFEALVSELSVVESS